MKKKALALLLSLLLIIGLAACGASSASGNVDMAMENAEAPEAMEKGDTVAADYEGISDAETAVSGDADNGGRPTSDKIIYSAYADIETQDFEASTKGVYTLIDRYEGFLETSAVTGNNYGDSRSSRSADFTIRIPSERFEALTNSLTELGNVTYSTTSAENITQRYNDTQSKLDAYEIEYDRLLAMLEKAATVEEMLAIEERLSDVRYHVQSLSNTLAGWDSLLSYSTVQLHLWEVVEYTEVPEQSYWQSVASAFSATLRGVGRFFKGMLKTVIALAPVLVILAAVAVVVFLAVRKIRRRRGGTSVQQKSDEEKGRDRKE